MDVVVPIILNLFLIKDIANGKPNHPQPRIAILGITRKF
jgi:hypothetical protein